MNNKKSIALMLAPILIAVSMLSGCIGPWTVITGGWENINTEATAVKIWGSLSLLESPDNWEEGFVWDTEKHDDINLYANRDWKDSASGLNTFSLNIDGLDRATTYHYRAFAEKQGASSDIKFGADNTFLPGQPRVWTVVPDNDNEVGIDFATLRGELTFLGGAPSCEVYFNYGTDPDLLTETTTPETMTSTGDFSVTLTGLTICETIYYKAIAENDIDIVDGYIKSVTPGQAGVQTYQPSEYGYDYAIFKGKLMYMGGEDSCEVWFEYSDKNPDTFDQETSHLTLDSVGEYLIEEELEPDTTYWVRAVGYNGQCDIAYGEVEQFNTKSSLKNNKLFSNINNVKERGELLEWILENKEGKTLRELIILYISEKPLNK